MNQKLLGLVGLMLLLTGCLEVSFKGTLKIDQTLKVKNTKNRMINLNPGNYTADINVSSKAVEVVVPVSRRDKQIFKLAIPKGMDLPENGQFTLTSAQSGQPFHLVADVMTEIRDTLPRRDIESCTYQRWETICTPTGPNGQVVCSQQPVTAWGRRMVVYFDRFFKRDLKAVIFENESLQTKLAISQGLNQSVQRIFLEQGTCF
jgi:hypothetical protein